MTGAEKIRRKAGLVSTSARAGVIYFAIMFGVEFLLGLARSYVLAPVIGAGWAAALVLPVMFVTAWMVSRTVFDRLGPRRRPWSAGVMGLVAFVLFLAGELVLSLGTGRGVAEHFALYRTAPMLFGLGGQMLYAVFPLIQVALAGHPRE